MAAVVVNRVAAMWDNRYNWIMHDKSRRPLRSRCTNCSKNQQHKLAVNRSWMASEHHICRVWHSWNSRDGLLLLLVFSVAVTNVNIILRGGTTKERNNIVCVLRYTAHSCLKRSKTRNFIDKTQRDKCTNKHQWHRIIFSCQQQQLLLQLEIEVKKLVKTPFNENP